MKKCCILCVLSAVFLFCAVDSHTEDELDLNAIVAFLKGAFCESRNNLPDAYRYYSIADHFDPGNRTIRLRLANVSLELGDLEKARRYAEHLTETGLYESEACLILAEIDYRRGDKEAALVRLLELLEREDIERFRVLKVLSKVYLELGNFEGARIALEEARKLFSEDLYVNYKLGFIYSKAGEIDKAIESFENAVEISPGFTGAHLAAASLMQLAGRPEEAKLYYRNVLDLEPANRLAIEELADLLYEGGELTEGIELLEPLYNEGKLREGGIIDLGKFYYRAGRAIDALEIFKGLLTEMEENPFLLRIVSDIEIECGHFKTAYMYLRKLIGLEPDKFSNYVGILLIVNDLAGEVAGADETIEVTPAEARQYLEEAIKRACNDSIYDNYLIGTVCMRMKRSRQAERYLLRAEQLDPDDRRTLLELAKLYEQQERFDEALKRITHLYEKDTEDASLINFYGYILAEKGENLDMAEELLNKALQKQPDNGYFLDSLGWIRFKRGDYEGALKILADAIEDVGDDPVIWEHLGDTYEKLELLKKALEAYEKSFSIDPDRKDIGNKLRRLKGSDSAMDK